MPLPRLSLLSLALAALAPLAARADELEEEKDHLIQKLKDSGSFIATYEWRCDKELQATFQIAAHYKSGWAYVRQLNGMIPMREKVRGWLRLIEIVRTTGRYKMLVNPTGETAILRAQHGYFYDGTNSFLKDLRKVARELNPGREDAPIFRTPSLLLGKDSISFAVLFGNGTTGWISAGQKMIKRNDDEVVFSHPEHGKMIIERSSGLLLSQQLNSERGLMSMTLTKVIRKPGWPEITREIGNLPPGLPSRPFYQCPAASQIIHFLFQTMIRDKKPLDFSTHLILREEAFIRFLEKQPISPRLGESGRFLSLLEEQVQKRAKRLKVPVAQVLNDERFRQEQLRMFALNLQNLPKAMPAPLFFERVLGKPLQARTKVEEFRKSQIEQFFQHCLLRTELERDLKLYRKDLGL